MAASLKTLKGTVHPKINIITLMLFLTCIHVFAQNIFLCVQLVTKPFLSTTDFNSNISYYGSQWCFSFLLHYKHLHQNKEMNTGL